MPKPNRLNEESARHDLEQLRVVLPNGYAYDLASHILDAHSGELVDEKGDEVGLARAYEADCLFRTLVIDEGFPSGRATALYYSARALVSDEWGGE